MTVIRTSDRLIADALAEARSTRPVAPGTSAGPARQRWPGDPADLTAGAHPGAGPLDLERLLAYSLKAGPIAPGSLDRDEGDAGGPALGAVSTRLRPVASAGGLHPVNAHLLVGQGCSLPPGRYVYGPLEHRAHRRGPAPYGVSGGTVVVLTVTAQRTASHYGHRAWPLLLLDTGHAVAALAMAALAHGHRARLTLDADASALAAAAGLPPPGRWHTAWPGTTPEHPLAAVHLTVRARGDEPDLAGPCPLIAWTTEPPAAPPAPGPAPGPAGRHAGAVLDALTRGTGAATWQPAESPINGADWFPAGAIADRRSAPPPLDGEPAPSDLATVLAAAAKTGSIAPSPCSLSWCAAVGGHSPGLVTADPAQTDTLRPVAGGEARPTLAVWAAAQGWLAEAGAVLLADGIPDSASPRGIRTEHLAAGYAVACAELTATALGLRTRPVGSWQGADLGAALGGPARQRWVVHGLALASPPPSSAPSHFGSDRR
ncbi:nitroreductase family protein [Spirillospora sp. CA-255316]